jgi:DNA mismatch repair protein MutS
VIMAYCGSFVAASQAELGPIDKIMTRIGASDDLSQGQSTFMVEMSETAHILREATANSLLLIDEIGRGTATYDGLSLAHAIAAYLLKKTASLCLFATHYFELTQLAQTHANCFNLHVKAAEHASGVVFLHQVAQGPASKSYGIEVGRLAGLPAEVIRAARAQLTQLEASETALNLQASLFDDAPVPVSNPQAEAIYQQLRSLDVDDLSPKAAHALLAELAALAGH